MKEIDKKLKDKIYKENVISKYGFCNEDFMNKIKKDGDNMQ